jgi:MFS family permease
MAAYALSVGADWALTVVLAVVAHREAGANGVALVTVLRMVPAAAVTPALASIVDRWPRDRALAGVALTRSAALGAGAICLATGAALPVLATFAVAASAAANLYRPAHSALVPTLCATASQLTSVHIVRGVVEAAAGVAGPMIAAGVLALADPWGAMVVACAMSTASAVVGPRVDDAAPPRRARARGRSRSGALRDPDLRLVLGSVLAQTSIRGALGVLTVVVAVDVLRAGEPAVGYLTAAMGAGGVAGAVVTVLLVGDRHLGRWLMVGLVLWGAPIAVLGAGPNLAIAAFLLAVVGGANAVVDVPMFALPARLAPEAALGRVFGILEALVATGVGLGAALAAALLANLGVSATLVVVGSVLPVLAALWWRRAAALDRRLAVRDADIEVLRRAEILALAPLPVLEQLARGQRRRLVAAGRDVVTQGSPGSSLFVVVSGAADVVGDLDHVGSLGPGDTFGEIAVLRAVPRTATVRARTALEVVEISREAFLEAVGRHQPTGDRSAALAASRAAAFLPR